MPLDGERIGELFGFAVVEDGDHVSQLKRLFPVVGDEDRGQAKLVVDLAQGVAQFVADLGVERAERFVQQQDARLAGKGAGQRDALSLAT